MTLASNSVHIIGAIVNFRETNCPVLIRGMHSGKKGVNASLKCSHNIADGSRNGSRRSVLRLSKEERRREEK